MRLLDIAKNIDKSEENECYVDLEVLQQELDLPVYGYAEQDPVRLKAYWVDNWYCTDTWVGGRMYFFDGEPVAYSYQQGRKFEEDFAWFSKEAAEKVRDFVESLSKRELQVNVVDMNENLGDSYKIEFASQVLDWSKARYHGEPIEFVRVVRPADERPFILDDRVQIRRPGSEWSFEADMEELDFLFHVNESNEKLIDEVLANAAGRCEKTEFDAMLVEMEL